MIKREKSRNASVSNVQDVYLHGSLAKIYKETQFSAKILHWEKGKAINKDDKYVST